MAGLNIQIMVYTYFFGWIKINNPRNQKKNQNNGANNITNKLSRRNDNYDFLKILSFIEKNRV
jgi:hypothetical protein